MDANLGRRLKARSERKLGVKAAWAAAILAWSMNELTFLHTTIRRQILQNTKEA